MKDTVAVGLDDVLSRSPGLEMADLDGEVALFSAEKGIYVGLNEVGSRIWALLERPSAPRRLCATLLEEYAVSPEACEQEVLRYLGTLLHLGVLRLSPGAESP